MRYTAPELITIIAALGILIAGVGAVIVNIIVALRSGTKLDTVIQQVEEVHSTTNSNLAAVQSELANVTGQNALLLEVVQDLKAERAKAALTAALLAAPPAPANAEATAETSGGKEQP